MAKSKERLLARKLRQNGISVRKIAKKLKVSKGTASRWVSDIVLSVKQLEKLRHDNIVGSEKGRLLGSLKQKQARLKRIEQGITLGKQNLTKLTRRELLAVGVALYWAEGSKKDRTLSFCNSDPKLISFMINWLKLCFNIPVTRLKCCVGINQTHQDREINVRQYWSRITKIPLQNFTKTSFKKVQNNKIYENHQQHFGTLTVKVTKPGQIYHNVLGLIEGLYYNQARVAQW